MDTCWGSSSYFIPYELDSEQLTDLANMYGIESVVIDKNTDIKEFEKELKWNDLYWRLNK